MVKIIGILYQDGLCPSMQQICESNAVRGFVYEQEGKLNYEMLNQDSMNRSLTHYYRLEDNTPIIVYTSKNQGPQSYVYTAKVILPGNPSSNRLKDLPWYTMKNNELLLCTNLQA